MTGNELIKAIRKHSGKVMVTMLIPNDVMTVVAEKKDLCLQFSKYGDKETGMVLEVRGGEAFVGIDYTKSN